MEICCHFVLEYVCLFTATFIMECDVPLLGASSLEVLDLCWLDDSTLVLTRISGKQVLKATVDTQTKTCSYVEVDSGYETERIDCSPDGNEFYVIDNTNGYARVYNRYGVNTAIWEPLSLVNKPYTVAINSKMVAVTERERGQVFLYNRNREYLYEVMINHNFEIYSSHLTETGIFLHVTGLPENATLIHDLNEHSTTIVSGQFKDPTSVCTAGDYVLVADKLNHRVPVYTLKGKFIHNLQFIGTSLQYPKTVEFAPGKHLLAVHIGDSDCNKIKILSLGP